TVGSGRPRWLHTPTSATCWARGRSTDAATPRPLRSRPTLRSVPTARPRPTGCGRRSVGWGATACSPRRRSCAGRCSPPRGRGAPWTRRPAAELALLAAPLAALPPVDGRRADPRHGDVRGVLAHLADNDALLAAELGLPAVPGPATDDGPAVRAAWRTQA